MKILRMMTGGGQSVEDLAEMVRQFGRGNDKILAHITPEEAAKLKEMGGRGTINPMTGLPEFEIQDFDLNTEVMRQQAEDQFFEAPSYETADYGGETFYEPMGRGVTDVPPSFYAPDVQRELEVAETERMAPVSTRATPAADEQGFLQRAEGALRSGKAALDRYPMLTRAGSAIGSTLGQALIAARANRQRDALIAQERQRGQPFRQASEEALARGREGGLTPAEAQALDIELARARQGLSARNIGTGSAAAGIQAGQRSRAQSVARQQSFAEALRLAGIADQYERRALEQELAKDTELAKLFADIVGREITQAGRTQAPAPAQTGRG